MLNIEIDSSYIVVYMYLCVGVGGTGRAQGIVFSLKWVDLMQSRLSGETSVCARLEDIL